MRFDEILRFSSKALTGHRLRSGLSLTGVAIGIAAVVLLTALGEGARHYVLDQFAAIGTNIVAVMPGKVETVGAIPGFGGAPNDLTLADAEALRRALPEAELVVPIVVAQETVSHGERRRQVVVVGATRDFLTVRRLTIAQGQTLPLLDFTRGAPVVVLGDRVARELFPAGDVVGGVVRVGDRRCRVLGVLASRGQQLGMNLDEVVLLPVATAMDTFNRRTLFRILLEGRPGSELDQLANRARAVLVERHGEDDVTLLTEDTVVASLSSILGVLTLAVAAIGGISLSVAGIGIMNVMLVAVSERTREIGLLRAVGASRGQVLTCFLVEAALLSLAGGVAGVLLGWIGTGILSTIWPALSLAPAPWAVGSSLLLALVVGLVFGFLPARRATRLDPITALGRR